MNTTAAIKIWSECLNFIKDNIPEQSFATWFLPIQAVSIENSILTVQVPSRFFYEWLEEHYIKLLKTSLQKVIGIDAKLVYNIVVKKDSKNLNDHITVNIPSSNTQKVKSQNFTNFYATGSDFKNPFIIPGLQKIKVDAQLNHSYSFDNFIEGESNRLGRSGSLAVSEKPGGTSFNPLFLYGGVGLGKTHLANAIGLKVKELFPEKIVLYVSMEKFTQQFIDSVKSNNRNDFIHFYQMIDVLIVDDVHFLSGKKATQDVFFHIFNQLHQNNKQLILTSDKSPIDIQDIEKRLISRFKWGLSAEINKPDFVTRKAILKSKLLKDGFELSEEIIDFVANSVKSNVRELEGAIISLIAHSSLTKKEITLDLAKKTLEGFINYARKEISIEFIQQVISDYLKVPIESIQSKTRKRDVVQARHLSMYFAKKYTNSSLSSIGSKIGKRDHATVLHACKTVVNLSETDKVFKGYVDEIDKKIFVN
ncbi:MAG: chromosomal replication initiator protein DnaA [Solirubrobacteraceae bacterium]